MTLDLVSATGLGANTYPNGPFVYDPLVDPVAFKLDTGSLPRAAPRLCGTLTCPDPGTGRRLR